MSYIDLLNNNKFFWGSCMLFLNMGSRFVIADLGSFNEKILSHNLVKKFILFCLFFVATRDILTSLLLTIAFSIIIYGLFNENSKYSLVPQENEMKNVIKKYYNA
jgi:hypothetical protein